MQLSYDYAKDRALMCLRANYESHLWHHTLLLSACLLRFLLLAASCGRMPARGSLRLSAGGAQNAYRMCAERLWVTAHRRCYCATGVAQLVCCPLHGSGASLAACAAEYSHPSSYATLASLLMLTGQSVSRPSSMAVTPRQLPRVRLPPR